MRSLKTFPANYSWNSVPFYRFSFANLLVAKVRKPGYIYIYISNENPVVQEVYFDNLKIRHIKSPAIQYSEYYPFGLQTACSWTRDYTTNNFLYNGGTELNQSSGVYDLFFRSYDPVLGRMNGVDPLAHKYAGLTPYNYAFNDPVFWNDPMGADPNDPDPRNDPEYDKKKEHEDASTGPEEQESYSWFGQAMEAFARADAYFDELNGVVNPLYNDMTYGGASGVGGSAFVRYGPGDGGAIQYVSSGGMAVWNPWTREYLPLNSKAGQALLKNKGSHPLVEIVDMTKKAQQEPPRKVWYTYDHLDNMDIVRQHTLERTAKEEITTINVAVILYTDGIFGTDHEIIKYGTKTVKRSLDHLEFNPKVLGMPRYDSPILGGPPDFDANFYEKIYGMVNEHLDCDCYTVVEPKFDVGAPVR